MSVTAVMWMMLIAGAGAAAAGFRLARKYRQAAEYAGIGNPYGWQGLWAALGRLAFIFGLSLALVALMVLVYRVP